MVPLLVGWTGYFSIESDCSPCPLKEAFGIATFTFVLATTFWAGAVITAISARRSSDALRRELTPRKQALHMAFIMGRLTTKDRDSFEAAYGRHPVPGEARAATGRFLAAIPAMFLLTFLLALVVAILTIDYNQGRDLNGEPRDLEGGLRKLTGDIWLPYPLAFGASMLLLLPGSELRRQARRALGSYLAELEALDRHLLQKANASK